MSSSILQLFGLTIALLLVVLLITKKRPLYQAMIAGILVVSLFLGKSFQEVSYRLWQGLIDATTLQLVLAVGLVSLISWLLKELDFLEKLLDSLVTFLGSAKITAIIVPALIGVFPVIGGAIISAPLVDVLGDKLALSKVTKTSVNMVFRHSVYYFSPFTSSLILLSGITGIELLVLIKHMLPLGLISTIAGYFFYLHKAKENTNKSSVKKERNLTNFKKLMYYGAPLFVSLGAFVFLRLPLLISLLAGVITIMLLGKDQKLDYLRVIKKGPDYRLMLGIAGIMVFRFLLEDLQGLMLLLSSLTEAGIPLFVIFIIMPFVIGWVSASFSITVGLTAPFLFALLDPHHNPIPYAVLLYASGFFSYFTSPIHLCQIVSNNYFKVNPFDAYKKQLPVLFITFITGLLLFAISVVN